MAGERSYYKNLRLELKPLLPTRARRVLEIGCGEGMFRVNLPDDCEYHGVEMSASAAAIAATRLSSVLVGPYEQVCEQLPNHHFDLVVCNDVIEHMRDHDAFLDHIKVKMATGACMVGSIPNIRYYSQLKQLLLDKEWQYTDDGTLDRTHLRFFTERSWRRTLVAHGYDVQRLQGIIPVHLGDTFLRVLINRAVIALVGADIRFLQFGFRAGLV